MWLVKGLYNLWVAITGCSADVKELACGLSRGAVEAEGSCQQETCGLKRSCRGYSSYDRLLS